MPLLQRAPIPQKLPKGMGKIVRHIESAKSKEECLRVAYTTLSKKYRGYTILTYLRLPEVFISDTEKLWKKNGFLHCTNMNHLLRVLLIASGKFKEEDIVFKWMLLWFISPHQCVQVRISKKKWVTVDLWGNAYGTVLGQQPTGFPLN